MTVWFRSVVVLRGSAVGLVLCLVAAWIIIPHLIESVYGGTSWYFLNSMISEQANHPLEDYLRIAYWYLATASLPLLAISALTFTWSFRRGRSVTACIIRERYVLVSLFILLVAVALRFFQLGGNSLWFDEAVYANNSMTDFWSFIENTRTSNSAPILLPYLYYFFGESLRDPLLIRIPPAIFSILSVAVMLALPRAGVSFSAAALSAFILAVAPAQIQYAQEVREYSLSVLFSCTIIFAYAFAVNKPSKRSLYYFSLVLITTPFASYGAIFMALAAVVAFLFIEVSEHKYRRRDLLIPVISLLVGIALTYQLTAMHQMHVAKSWHLAHHYPPVEILAALKWLARSGLAYFRQAIGGWQIGLLSLLLVFVYMISSVVHRAGWKSKQYFCLVLVILVAGSILAAIIGAYPFGGIRQHLFATPLIILCVAQSVVSLGTVLRKNGIAVAIFVFAFIVSFNSFFKIPQAYAETEDVVSAVSEGLKGVPDANVYVYYAAKHAVAFHYPERNFFVGAEAHGDIERIGKEIVELTKGCNVSVLFSHASRHEDAQILAYLENTGLKLIEDKWYHGARVVKFSRCADQH